MPGGALSAQLVRGTVSERGDGRALAGVVVLMLDSSGTAVTRALTNDKGEFGLGAPGPGLYRVRTLRIGFRPQTSDPLRLAVGQDLHVPIALTSVPVLLDTVRVASRNACRSAADSALATHAVWEQARAAFAAAQLTSRDQALDATLLTYERVLDPTFPRVRRQSSTFAHALSAQLWRTTSIDSLRRFGYVLPDLLGGRVFHAPDMNVLLSDAFLEDHCFGLVRGSDGEHVGIEFEPNRDRAEVADISGTVWLRRATAELRSLEFRYVGLKASESKGRPGGAMEFLRLPGGEWAVASWSIRMPVLEQVVERAGATSGAPQHVERVSEIRVTGGELVALSRDDQLLWSRPSLTFRALVRDSVLPRPIDGARIVLRGTQLSGLSGRSGTVAIAGVLPGEYTVDVRTASLDSVAATHTTSVNFTGSGPDIELRIPSANRAVAAWCGYKLPTTPALGLAIGTVTLRGDSAPPWNVAITAEWTAGTPRSASARTDAQGRYRICGIPSNVEFTVRTEIDDTTTAPRTARFGRGSHFAITNVVIDVPASEAGTMFAGSVQAMFNSEPLAGAEVSLPDLGISVRTNEAGRFRIAGIRPGTHRVAVRRIGYAAVEQSVGFAIDRVTSRQFRLAPVATLETVTVTADRRMMSFEENRSLGLGKFLTREELAKMEFRTMGSVMSELGGADVISAGYQACLRTKRIPRWTPGQPAPPNNADNLAQGCQGRQCWSQVYVNGMLVNPGRPTPPFNLNDWNASAIEAIEFYPSQASLPMRYSHPGATCGVFVIHMRLGK